MATKKNVTQTRSARLAALLQSAHAESTGLKIARLGEQIAVADSARPERIAICSESVAREALELLPELRRMLANGGGAL